MNLRKMLTRSISETVSCVRTFAPLRQGLRILMYHAIGYPALGDQLGIFSLSPVRFLEHITYLSDHYSDQLVDLAPDFNWDNAPRIAITFDDDYLDNLKVAAPLLAKRQMPFTVFVTADFVRQHRPGFMAPADLRELASMLNVRIGAHGATHIPLSGCTDAILRQELADSRQLSGRSSRI